MLCCGGCAPNHVGTQGVYAPEPRPFQEPPALRRACRGRTEVPPRPAWLWFRCGSPLDPCSRIDRLRAGAQDRTFAGHHTDRRYLGGSHAKAAPTPRLALNGLRDSAHHTTPWPRVRGGERLAPDTGHARYTGFESPGLRIRVPVSRGSQDPTGSLVGESSGAGAMPKCREQVRTHVTRYWRDMV